MAFFTKQQFSSIATAKARTRGHLISEARTYSKSNARTSIFLSHAHTDRTIVAQAKEFFETLGFSIYVDWADHTMPERTNGTTATKIKTQIHSNKRFILLATDTAVASKWCNWEVGIGDILKLHTDELAILPLAENSRDWSGNEYLQIYPRIEPAEAGSYKVIYPDNRFVYLEDWLTK